MRIKHFQIRLTNEYLQADEDHLNEFLKTVVVKKTTQQLLMVEQTTYWSVLVFYDDISSLENHKNEKTVIDISTLTEEERTRYEALRTWRSDLARQQALPSYIFASNAELVAIAKLNPTTIEELQNVKGMGEKKISKYGEEIIGLLKSENTNVV
jgi:superfamily II DNA helicase RecQ